MLKLSVFNIRLAELYVDCQFADIFNTMNEFLTFEGSAGLTARLGFAAMFDLVDLIILSFESQDGFTRGRSMGRLFSIVFDYYLD